MTAEDDFHDQLDQLATILNPVQEPAPTTGICPVCEKPRALKKNGTLWNHGICRGAGQPPKEQP